MSAFRKCPQIKDLRRKQAICGSALRRSKRGAGHVLLRCADARKSLESQGLTTTVRNLEKRTSDMVSCIADKVECTALAQPCDDEDPGNP